MDPTWQRVLHQWFWDCYDFLGRLLAFNLLAFFLLGGGALLGLSLFLALPLPPAGVVLGLVLILALAGPLWGTLWLAPLAWFAAQASEERNPGFSAFPRGLLQAGPRVWALLQVGLGGVAVLLGNAWAYAGGLPALPIPPLIGYALGGFCLWLALGLLALTLVAVPFALREQRSPVAALRRAFLLTLLRPRLVLGTLAALLFFLVTGALVKLAGLLVFGFAGTGMLLNSLYDVVTEAEREANQSPAPAPTTWKEVEAAAATAEDQRQRRARYERSFRDVLRPWEG